MVINNIDELCEHFGTDTKHIERVLFKYTDCGAWIHWENGTVSIGSIVEGSDAEFSKTFSFPVDSSEIDSWMDELEELTDEAWHEANDYDEEDY